MHWGHIALGIGFWAFLTISAVTGMITEYKKRQLELEPLRAAVERGQQLDPAVIERLMAHNTPEDKINPLNLKVGGIICIAVGVGLAALAWFVAQVVPPAFFPMIGAGIMTTCVGFGLLVSTRVVEVYNANQAARGRDA
jgi:hypothetical protein